MKKRCLTLMSVALLGLMLSACSSNTDSSANPTPAPGTSAEAGTNTDKNTGSSNEEATAQSQMTAAEMAEDLLQTSEQPKLLDLSEADVKNLYYLDSALLEQFAIKVPLINLKTNELAVIKVKDAKDVTAVEDAIKKRAADVQKSFEHYLPDQYENAKNYKLVTKGNYVLFAIAEADTIEKLTKQFDTYFQAK